MDLSCNTMQTRNEEASIQAEFRTLVRDYVNLKAEQKEREDIIAKTSQGLAVTAPGTLEWLMLDNDHGLHHFEHECNAPTLSQMAEKLKKFIEEHGDVPGVSWEAVENAEKGFG